VREGAENESEPLSGAFWGLLKGDGLLLVHSADNGDQKIFSLVKVALDILSKISFGNLDIVFGSAVVSHEVKEAFINVDKLVFVTLDIGDVHVVSGRTDIFQFLCSEDIDGHKMDFGVTVFTSLGGGHVDDLARATFDDNVTILAEGRALHGEGQRSTRGCRLECLMVALIVGHFL